MNLQPKITFKLTIVSSLTFSKRFYPGHKFSIFKKFLGNLFNPINKDINSSTKFLIKKNLYKNYHWFSLTRFFKNSNFNMIFQRKSNFIEFSKDKVKMISNLEKPLLIASYPYKDYVSGLMTLTQAEQTLLNLDTPLGQEFREFLLKLLCKVNFSFFRNKEEILAQRLKKAFEIIYKKTNRLKMSQQLEKIIGERIIPFTQNFIVITWNNYKFDYDTLKNFCKEYDELKLNCFEGMTNIKILTFSEATNIKIFIELLKKFKIENYSFFLTEPENISKLPLYFSNIESLEQTGQKNADVLIGNNKDEYNNVTQHYHKIYYDIKSFVLAMDVDKCRFSLFHGSKKLYDRLFNDILTNLKRNFDKNLEFRELFTIAQSIKKKTHLSSNEKYIELLGILVNMIFIDNSSNIKPSFCIDAGEESDFDLFLTLEIITKIKEFARTQEAKDILLAMFPKIPLIDNKTNIENLLTFFEKVSPTLYDNFKDVILQ